MIRRELFATRVLPLFLGVLGLVAWSAGSPALAQDRFVPGEVLVAPEATEGEAVQQALRDAELTVLERDAFSGLLRVQVPEGSEEQWIATLSARGDVRYAERNGIGSGGLVPDDTFFFLQWHLQNSGQSGGVPGADIEVVPAWDITTGSSDVVIAVLDSGIDSDHPDFVGRIDPDGFDFVNTDNDPEDDHAHGTWVSGSMAANSDNSFAGAGVDHQCRILPIKVLDQFNLGTVFDLVEGLNYCASQDDVQVINMSLINYPGTMALNDALLNARTAGKILIACAGNGGPGNADVSFPGASPLTISIGATTRTDALAFFSATGNALDFVAPGEDITTTAFNTATNTFEIVSGCSFATPITAGVVGLLLARAAELGLPPLDQDDIYELLEGGAEDQVSPGDPPGPDTFFGCGRINAVQSLSLLETPEITAVSPPHGSVDGGTTLMVTGNNFSPGAMLSVDGSPIPTTFVSFQLLEGITSPHIQGTVDVSVSQASGSDTLVGAFTYTRAILRVEDTFAAPGTSGHEVDLLATYDVPLQGYSAAVDHDGTLLTVVEVSQTGTLSEGVDFFAPALDNNPGPAGGFWTLGVVVSFQSEEGIPPGEDNLLAIARYDISPAAPADGETILDLETLGDPAVDPTLVFSSDVSLPPMLIDGTLTFLGETPFLRGDVDANGVLGLPDPIAGLAFLFQGGDVDCEKSVDFDDNGQLILNDMTLLLDFLFQSGAPPMAPFPLCGADPTPDGLSCDAHAICP